MWVAALALAGIAAAESQCSCAESWNPVTKTCVADAVNPNPNLPTNYVGSPFLYDYFEAPNCPNDVRWDLNTHGYQPLFLDDQCSCIASNAINLATNSETVVGWTWDHTTTSCVYGVNKDMQMTHSLSNTIDMEECAYKLVNGYPGSFSHCGGLNMCHCALTNFWLEAAVEDHPDHNATGNAYNINGVSYRECGWDFDVGRCVPATEQYVGNMLSLRGKKIRANLICNKLGYYDEQTGRVKDLKQTRYVPPPYVSPTIALCAAKNTSACTCNEDPRCFMDNDQQCLRHLVDGVEENRTSTNITAELIREKCGDTYCNTLLTPCDCYDEPHSEGVCGWDGSTCDSTTTTVLTDMYEAHCCDAFKTPCECKVGRLPWAGVADFNNTCGWDHLKSVCRLSAITTNSEMLTNGCAVANDCILTDQSTDCNALGTCTWLPKRFTCVPEQP